MKKIFIVILFFFSFSVKAQHIELALQAYGGLFHFSGGTTSSESAVNLASSIYGQSPNNNPFGSNNAFSYGFGARATLVKKSGFIFGLSAGYELLRSSLAISSVYINSNISGNAFYDIISSYQINASGQTILTSKQVIMSPFIGYRIKVNKVKIDFMPGVDFGFNLKSTEADQASDTNGNNYFTSTNLQRLPTDLRLKFGAAMSFLNYGLTAGFSQGLTNLNKNTANNSANSEFLQLGISYKLL